MKQNNLPAFFFFTATLLAVFIFYFPTIFYEIKAFDEITPFKETYLPICFSLSEIPELISLLGLKQYFEASNTLYSSITLIRCNPLGVLHSLLIQALFRKEPVYYHLYGLMFHLMNTALVFLILNKISILFLKNTHIFFKFILVSTLTILWATHPVNVESVLLLINYNNLFSYSLFLLTVYIYLDYLLNNHQLAKFSYLKFTLSVCFFLIALFAAEYLFMLPFIIFTYSLAYNLCLNCKSMPHSKAFLLSIKSSVKTTAPLFIASIIFIISFIFSKSRINLELQNSISLILERIFWLSPQILFHLIKLLLVPVKLSVDQTSFVIMGKTLFSPYAVFCFVFIGTGIIFSIKSLFGFKKDLPLFFIIFAPFFLSLIPFSHILAPIYNLASERYLYIPSFILILGLSHFIFFTISRYSNQNKIIYSIIFLILIITVIYSTRAFIRIQDWKDSFTLYKSASETSDNPLYKALRYKMLTPQEKIFSDHPEKEVYLGFQELAITNIKLAIKNLKEEKNKYQSTTPSIVKSYGLDPATFLTKAGYLLAHSDYTINHNPQKALNIMNPFVKDLSLLDNAGLAFYASLHFFNKSPNEAEKILRYAHKKYPYSTRIIFPLCQLIYMQTGKLDEVETLSLMSYKYFPYDTFTLLYLIKLYMLKGDNEKYAFFSYAYGLRHHSVESLEIARRLYLMLNKFETAKKIEKRTACLRVKLKNQQ